MKAITRFLAVAAILVCILSIDLPALAASEAPVMLAFGCPVDIPEAVTDPDVLAAVVDQLAQSGKMHVLTFSPELPSVQRAVMERKIGPGLLKDTLTPEKAAQIAQAVGADYALCIQGMVLGTKVSIRMDAREANGKRSFLAGGEGAIAITRGPQAEVSRANAISTAASVAVSQIVIEVFGQRAAMSLIGQPPLPVAPAPPPVIAPIEEKPIDTAAEHSRLIRQADEFAAKRDRPNAIMALRRTVDMELSDLASRLRLADMYADCGMLDHAVDECKRALLFFGENVEVYERLAKFSMESGDFSQAAEQYRELLRVNPGNTSARLSLGDISWNLGKLDDARSCYEEASSRERNNPAPHARLHRLFSAKRMYAQALDHLLAARMLSAGGTLDDAGRYNVLAQLVQDEFNSVLGTFNTAREDFQSRKTTIEEYYQECRNATGRIEALADFLPKQSVPDSYRSANAHGMLAVSLLAQAGGSLVFLLETDKEHYGEEAEVLLSEAKVEMGLYAGALRKI